jgi:rare lipoprotein A
MVMTLSSASACALVGYPAGSSGEPPAPAERPPPQPRGPGPLGAPGAVAAGDLPADAVSDAGRTYEVFGEEYRVLDTSEGYREEGLASWYGRDFHGRPTSSGERYDMNRASAAHRTLPLHTWVEVTNLENGRLIVLRINDRGPFADVHERIIDLSYAAARELRIVGPGTARVEVRALSAGELARR